MMRALLTMALVTPVPSPSPDVSAPSGPEIRSITVRPSEPVIVGASKIRLVIDVVARGAAPGGVNVRVEHGADDKASGITADSTGEGWETWRFMPSTRFDRWYPTGLWTVTATARGVDGATTVAHTTFRLRHDTVLEGVVVHREGPFVTVSGTLMRLDPLGRVRGRLDYRPFRSEPVLIEFRKDAASPWRKVGSTDTDRYGWFQKSRQGQGKGEWRAHYAGTDRYAPDASSGKNPYR